MLDLISKVAKQPHWLKVFQPIGTKVQPPTSSEKVNSRKQKPKIAKDSLKSKPSKGAKLKFFFGWSFFVSAKSYPESIP